MNSAELHKAGLEALRRELGVEGMARFLQMLGVGIGDYTAERWNWLDPDADIETLVAQIQMAQQQRASEKKLSS